MFRLTVLPLLTILAMAITTNAQITITTCRANEFFTTCGPCEGTCNNPNPICDRSCRPAGCYCRTGFVRQNGACIAASSCSSSGGSSVNVVDHACNENEFYTTCGTCEGTCDNPNPICDRSCRAPGCYCMQGFVRDSRRRCVWPSTCNSMARVGRSIAKRYAQNSVQNCRPNEQYTTCGPCEPQCGQPLLFCTLQCRPAGCYCFNGFSRTANGDCVRDSDCPTVF